MKSMTPEELDRLWNDAEADTRAAIVALPDDELLKFARNYFAPIPKSVEIPEKPRWFLWFRM